MRCSRSNRQPRDPQLVEAEFVQAWPDPWHDRHLARARMWRRIGVALAGLWIVAAIILWKVL